MKYKEKLQAIKMRKQGKSYAEIKQKLSVSKGALSLWLRDVYLTEAQKKRLCITLKERGRHRASKNRQRTAKKRKETLFKTAKKESAELLSSPLFFAGTVLYWAEGDKSTNNEIVKFSNSDPKMIVLMIRWFKDVCKAPKEKIRIALHIHEVHNKDKIEKYWSKLTGIPLNQFHKTQIKKTSIGHRKNKLYNGTCSIRICSVNLFYKIQGWKEGILHHFKISLPS